MTQYVINIGAIPNDGTGDPLRTAFNETNLNFDQVFAAGPVLSNIQIANNKILTTNTNGNLVLAPNGTGVIQANVSIVPNLANLRNLGSATNRWSTVYTQYLNATQINLAGDLTVAGNLTVQGNIIQIGNIVTDSLTIQLANTASNASSANGAGITVGANDNIATILYNSTGNVWTTNIGISSVGNISAPYFVGNGSLLTGLADTYGDANVATFLAGFGSNTISTTGNITSNGLVSVNSLRVNQTANAWIISGNFITAPSGAFWSSNVISKDEYITSALDGYINLTSRYANGNTASQVHLEHGLAQIVVDNGVENIWAFDDTGNLTLPGNSFAVNYANGNPVSLGGTYGNSNVTTLLANFGNNTISTSGNITGGNIFGNIQAADGNTSVMFNQQGFLGADAGFSYDYADNTLYVETVSILGKNTHGDNAVYVGVTGYTALGSNVVAQFAGNADSYTQINFQNINPSPTASGDYIITANNGTDSANFIDMGIAGNTWDGTQTNSLGNAVSANDGYLYVNGGNLVVGTFLNSGNVINTWKFGSNGNLTLPGANANYTIATQGGYITVGNLLIGQGGALFNSNNDSWALYGNISDPGATIFIPSNADAGNGTALYIESQQSNVEIRSGSVTWNFDSTGNLTVPGNIIMTTGIVGSGASPAPSLSGFSSVSAVTVSASGNISATGNVTSGNVSTGVITLTNGATIQDTSGDAVAFGQNAGLTSQGNFAVGIGRNAGQTTQGGAAVAIGVSAGDTSQGNSAVAVGQSAGFTNQSANTVAVGVGAGQSSQGVDAVAVGSAAGSLTQGIAAVAIGALAGRTFQANNSIIINATGANLDQTTANTFTVAPVRNDVANTAEVMFYNTTSKEITYGNVISVAGNITGGNLTVGSGTITGGNVNGSIFNGNVAFGTGTVGGSGNITGGNLITTGSGGDITMSGGNITGVGNISAGNVSATGNVTAANFFGNGNTLSNVATQVKGSWTVTTGTNNYSFTVPINNTYQLWVNGNIPNGIIVYNATVSVSNTNVPVIGQQFAWNYEGAGNPITFTSIPAQIIGTANAISNANPSVGTTTNVFTFGINNSSGNTVTVNYGYTKIS